VTRTGPETRSADEYETRLRSYEYEYGEEARAVRVGEKEVSESAAILERYSDLFSRPQLEALRREEEAAEAPQARERLYRLRKTCEGGVVSTGVATQQDELANAELASRVEFRGDSLPLRTAQARLATLAEYGEREELGARAEAESARLNGRRLELIRAREELEASLSVEPDPVARADEEKAISLRRLAQALTEAAAATVDAFEELRGRWLDRLLGGDRPEKPASYHAAYLRRLTPLAHVYTRERATDVCLATLREIGFDLAAMPNIRADLDDRPQKSPRPCVIPSDPPGVVHLITRAQGGLQDYQGFLHEAGHALHFAGCDPELPFTFRSISRDNSLTEIYSYACESISREPGWHMLHFGLDEQQATENAEATRFLDAFLFRRYVAKLEFELDFWSRFAVDGGTPDGYAERLTEATGTVYHAARFLSDMDAGFYSADYLRAWIRSAQLRASLVGSVGPEWWRSRATGELLGELFREGTRPSSEEIAGRLGFDPLDTGPLVAELRA
jgi:hypothetical protein